MEFTACSRGQNMYRNVIRYCPYSIKGRQRGDEITANHQTGFYTVCPTKPAQVTQWKKKQVPLVTSENILSV